MRKKVQEIIRMLLPGIIASCFLIMDLSGQISLPGEPAPLWYEGAPAIVPEQLQVPDESETSRILGDSSGMLKPAGKAQTVEVMVQPSTQGIWDTLGDGSRLWRHAFTVDKASLLSLVFSPYKLNKGVKVFIYDPSQQNVLGAFTDLNNKSMNLLATSFIPGNTVIVEMQVPAYLKSYGQFGITELGYDEEDQRLKSSRDPWYGESGWCNTDVNCVQSIPISTVKNAVVRIVFNGSQRCTGTLLNTVEKTGAEYILTAAHCFTKYTDNKPYAAESDANEAIFYFNYELPYCGGSGGYQFKSVSGATIRAWSDEFDLALLELLEPVPFHYHPYYAGWDYSGKNPTGVFAIHHPWGDVKKLSIEQDSLQVVSFPNDNKTHYVGNAHWLVSRWEQGTTEAGSSGAPLFDQYGRITGTLTGGQANCGYPIKDYFQMFSRSWRNDLIPGRELSEWLDPYVKSRGFMNGYDPYSAFWLSGDTLSNIRTGEPLIAEDNGLLWGSYSGHSSAFHTEFSEKFTSAHDKAILGILINVAGNSVVDSLSRLSVKIYQGSELPEKVLHEQKVYLADLSTGINLISFDSAVVCGNTFFAGYEIEYNTLPDTFSVYMAQNRIDDTTKTAYVFNGLHWESLSSFTGGMINSSFAVLPLVYDTIPVQAGKPELDKHIGLYPNPARHIIQLIFDDFTSEPVQLLIADMQGKVVYNHNYGPYQRIIPVNLMNYSTGIYLVRIREGDKLTHLKFSVVK